MIGQLQPQPQLEGVGIERKGQAGGRVGRQTDFRLG
jgi:hypothetical protein